MDRSILLYEEELAEKVVNGSATESEVIEYKVIIDTWNKKMELCDLKEEP